VSIVAVSMLGQRVQFHCTYFYCKTCQAGDSPMRRWLGIHDGEVSLGVERAVTHLTMKETFGESASQLKEQHGQEFDRTKLERITYRVGAEAEHYLELRRTGRADSVIRSLRTHK